MNVLDMKVVNTTTTHQFNILIVDDCRVSSLYLSKLLAQLGFTSVDHVSSYQQAIQICSKRHYSLLFIDYHLEQILNGSELYDLLKGKGFIQPYTRVITISGDNTTQTVLSTLSKGSGDYLCKPISKSILRHKMTDAINEYHMFKKLYSLNTKTKKTKLKEKVLSLAKSKNINELDQLLFELYSENEKTDLLALCQLPEFSKRKNYILIQLQIKNELNLSTTEELIKNTKNLCQQHHLFTPAYDLLTKMQITQLQYEDALLSSSTALDLTPKVPSRALQTLKLALNCNNKNYFLKASHLLANHLPVADQNWCTYIAECFNYYDEYIQNCQSECDRKQLLLEQKNFVRRSEYRLTSIQKKQLSILFSFSENKRLIMSGHIVKAKQNTLKVIQPFFDNLHQLNSVVLVELLYLLSFFGELWLLERVNTVLKTKHQFNDYCLDSLRILKNDKELKDSLQMLSNTLEHNNRLQGEDLTSEKLLLIKNNYQDALTQYPYSSELCIGLLECYIPLSLDDPKTISVMIALVQNMPLSENLMKRREAVFKALHAHKSYIEEKSTVDLKLNIDSLYIKKNMVLLNSSRSSTAKLLP